MCHKSYTDTLQMHTETQINKIIKLYGRKIKKD